MLAKNSEPKLHLIYSLLGLFPRLHLICLLAFALLGLSSAADEKRLAIYTPQLNFSVAVFDHDSHEFVSVTDLLDPFGQATLTRDGKHWRLTFEAGGKTTKAEFSDGSAKAKVQNHKLALGRSFWTENQRGYIPITAVPAFLTQFVAGSANLRENSRRLFIENVSTTYSPELHKGNPSSLVLHFSASVSPAISTEPGHVRMLFTHEPIVATGTNPLNFDDPAIRSLSFSENNGSAELVVNTAIPVLASFADNGKTITITPAPIAQAPAPKPVPIAPSTTPTAQTPIPAPATPAIAPQRFLVIIDPAHGGDDPGAALGEGLLEKDVTLAIARRIRANLDQQGIAAVLLRDGDATLTLDQRASAANASRASIYLCIHADSLGSGVRLYSARFNQLTPRPSSRFLPWNTAQAAFLDQSHNLAASLVTEFESHQIQAVPLESGLRPLRNIGKPAIAIEVAPPNATLDGLTSATYQQSVANAIAVAIANVRSSLETNP